MQSKYLLSFSNLHMGHFGETWDTLYTCPLQTLRLCSHTTDCLHVGKMKSSCAIRSHVWISFLKMYQFLMQSKYFLSSSSLHMGHFGGTWDTLYICPLQKLRLCSHTRDCPSVGKMIDQSSCAMKSHGRISFLKMYQFLM